MAEVLYHACNRTPFSRALLARSHVQMFPEVGQVDVRNWTKIRAELDASLPEKHATNMHNNRMYSLIGSHWLFLRVELSCINGKETSLSGIIEVCKYEECKIERLYRLKYPYNTTKHEYVISYPNIYHYKYTFLNDDEMIFFIFIKIS